MHTKPTAARAVITQRDETEEGFCVWPNPRCSWGLSWIERDSTKNRCMMLGCRTSPHTPSLGVAC